MKKKLFHIVLALIICLQVFSVSVPAAETASVEDIVIFYTNDVHSYIDQDLTLSMVAALKDSCEHALLVDAGDHVQGAAFGGMDNGETVIRLMNAAGYDLATLGNHEFDYGQDGRILITDTWAEYDYVSCNFHRLENGVPGETVLDSYKMFEINGTQIAIIGISTPETITSSAASYFQDENGNYIYGVYAGADGSELYGAVQCAIDAALAEGADYVIALGHLGVDHSAEPWTSELVIANTAGLDAFIDGHSHTSIPMRELADKNGDTVVLTQTGLHLAAVGKLTISEDGGIVSQLLSSEDLAELEPDAEVKAMEDRWIAEVEELLGGVIGNSEVTFDNYDSSGRRLVRKQNTNSGDFCADALYYLFDNLGVDVDVAVMNGGGVRNGALSGELSYKKCKEIHAFGNQACLLKVTGQQLLDALEWGSRTLTGDGTAESGSLLHVSGAKYTLDLSFDSTVQSNELDVWVGAPTGEYRVKDVQILDRESGEYEPLDLTAEYNLSGYDYTLLELGGGFAMLTGAEKLMDGVEEDYMVLANYIRSFPVDAETGLPTIRADSGYAEVSGSGRIHIDTNRSAVITTLWELEGEPVAQDPMPFDDIPDDADYAEALRWAAAAGIVNGYGDAAFGPNDTVTREQLAAILWRYAGYKGYDLSIGESTNILSYEDIAEVSKYAIPALQWTCGSGLMSGEDAQLLPDAAVSRRQLIILMEAFLALYR